MKKAKKTITLRSIRQLWKQTGRRPVEMPLITPELVDEITAQPRQAGSLPIRMPAASRPTFMPAKPRHRLAWAMAACVLLLVGAVTFRLTQKEGGEEQKQVTARVGTTIGVEDGFDQSDVKNLPLPEAKKVPPRNDRCQQIVAAEKHQWYTESMLASTQKGEHDNAGVVCYSEGCVSDNCDEETVTAMLLAFL